jgi:SUKH-4 immunity protein of toxin-antitoxin system
VGVPVRPRVPWPRFGLVTVTGGFLPPRLATVYPALTVPCGGIGACTPTTQLTLVRAPGGRELIHFGALSYGVMCLDPADGHVVDMVTGSLGDILRPPHLVNSSHGQYVATVREATARFPFHSDDPDIGLDAVADSLRAQLRSIDPPAWDTDGYWDTFYWDVAIGDYSPAGFEPPGR